MSHVSDTLARHAQQDNDNLHHALGAVLETPEGREIYRWIKANSRVFSQAPTDGLHRWSGWRDFGLFLLDTMRSANLMACHMAETEGAHTEAFRYAAIEEARRADERETRENELFPPQTSNQQE